MQCTSEFFARHGAYEDERRLQSLMDRCEMKRNEINSCNCVTSRKSMRRIVRHSLMTCVGKSPCRLQASCPRAQSRKAISTPCSNRAEPARAIFPSKAVYAPNNPNPLWHQHTNAKIRAPLSSARLKGKAIGYFFLPSELKLCTAFALYCAFCIVKSVSRTMFAETSVPLEICFT